MLDRGDLPADIADAAAVLLALVGLSDPVVLLEYPPAPEDAGFIAGMEMKMPSSFFGPRF